MVRQFKKLCVLAVAGVAIAVLPPPVLANDTEAELAVGGLTLIQSKSISMDSEDLFISQNLIRVTYRFTNTSSSPVTATVAFPLPQLPVENNDSRPSFPGDFRKLLNFKTVVDGKPATLSYVTQAILKGKDVTDTLDKYALQPAVYDGKGKTLSELNAKERKELEALGLITVSGYNPDDQIEANWDVRVLVTRSQVFPAKKTVTVRHSYTPITGGSISGRLESAPRDSDSFREAKSRYCMDTDWINSLDRAIAKQQGTAEVWIGYILSSGANWKGPIKDFTLTLDKGNPASLLSVCETGLKKISPTQFRVKRTNFTPTKDLDILIVNFYPLQN